MSIATQFAAIGKLVARTRRPQPQGRARRADIQGLRAVAVLAVILDHLMHWPSGGFVGVDVFFVISGFMITGQLMREHDDNGRISFSAFYKRRIRRLVPASVTVLIMTTVAALTVFSQPRFWQTFWDAVAALFFAGNWRMAAAGTDYFQAGSPPSPLQHFWSLGVEEQFYVVWPALMVAVFFVGGRWAQWDTKRAHKVLGGAMVLLIGASLGWAFIDTATNPTVAYFSTFSRVWELGVGALIAVTATAYHHIPEVLRPALAWTGLAGIAVSLFFITAESAFPAPWALLPVASAALVIIANEGGKQKRVGLLTHRVMVYLGDISYSLYLWHFPIIIIGGVFFDVHRQSARLGILLATLIIAVYAFHLLEDPVRKSSWLDGERHKPKWSGRRVTSRYRNIAMSFLALLTVSLSVVAVDASAPDVRPAPAAAPHAAALTAKAPTAGPASKRLQAQIAAAVGAAEWPDLNPSMDSVIGGAEVPSDVAKCGDIGPLGVATCTWGSNSAPKTAVIVGDSIGMTYATVLRDALKGRADWRLRSYAAFGCIFTDVQNLNPVASITAGCPAKKAEAVAAIKSLHPDVVFIANMYGGPRNAATQQNLDIHEYAASTRRLVDTFRSSTKKLVFLAPPPADVDPKTCYSKVSEPADCMGTVSENWAASAVANEALAHAVNGVWVDSRPYFCDYAGSCPSFVGATPVKVDKLHMSPAYQRMIAPAVAEELVKLKVLPRVATK